jgi:hypothetical protein
MTNGQVLTIIVRIAMDSATIGRKKGAPHRRRTGFNTMALTWRPAPEPRLDAKELLTPCASSQ